jgi:acyl dehydratase
MNVIENRTFDELKVGEAASLTRTLTYKDIELFAIMSGDVNPAHVDEVFAKSDMFHKIVAHGMWGGALVSTVLGTLLPGPGTIYIGQSLHFRSPVGLDDTITVTVKVAEKKPEHHRGVLDCQAVNQRGEVVIAGTAEVIAPQDKISRPRVVLPEVELREKGRCHRKLVEMTLGLAPIRTAVVHPVDTVSLLGALEAAREMLIVPVLVGPEAKIRAAATQAQLDISPYELISTEHSEAAAVLAVTMARAGRVEALMKGALHTDELMHAVVDAENGLRTARRISHVFVIDGGRCSSRMRRSMFIPRSMTNGRSCKTRSTWHARSASRRQKSRSYRPWKPSPRKSDRRSTLRRYARWPTGDRSLAASSTGRSPSTTLFRTRPPNERHRLSGRGRSRYSRRPRRRSREYAGQAARIFGGSRNRGHRARRPRTHYPHEPLRQAAGAAGLLRDRAAAGSPCVEGQIMTGNILVLSTGSSSIKFSLYAVTKDTADETPLCEGAVDGIGHDARFHAAGGQGDVLIESNLGETETHRRRFPPC